MIRRSIALGLAALLVGCTSQLGIVSHDDALVTPADGRRIVLHGRRTRIETLTPPLPATTLWFTLPSDDPNTTAAPGTTATAGFTLSFLVENESDQPWTLRGSDLHLASVDRTGDESATALLRRARSGASDVLVTLPPGGAATLAVPFAISAPDGTLEPRIAHTPLFGRIFRLQVDGPAGQRLLQRHVELGQWNQAWQGTRAVLLATLVFLMWGALA